MNEQEQEKPIGLPSHSLHFPYSPPPSTFERMNLACKEAASRIGVSDRRSQKERGVRRDDVTNDCNWHPLGTGRPRLDSQELELGFVPQRARASRFN